MPIHVKNCGASDFEVRQVRAGGRGARPLDETCITGQEVSDRCQLNSFLITYGICSSSTPPNSAIRAKFVRYSQRDAGQLEKYLCEDI